MKKSEPPHILSVQIGLADKSICGKCSCVAGASGYCHHVVGLFFYMSHCKHLGLKSLPDELTCTSLPQMWSVPRQRKIANKAIQDVMVKKLEAGADYTNGMTFSVISMRQLSSVKEFIMMQNFFRLPKIMWMPSFFIFT